ncbi:MAG: DUF512 domain-containing protein [Bacillota bacterium]
MHTGGTISAVPSGSLGEAMGLSPGDVVVSIDGQALRDIIDYRFLMAGEEVKVLVRKATGEEITYHLEKDYSEDLGVEFTDVLFDGVRSCNNACEFCFLQQMPPGLRPSLYVKDDDFRLSFLYGNFITLSNLKDEDYKRIKEQGLSPLYVSVHATRREIRKRLMKCDMNVMEGIRRLVGAGVEIHTQVVLLPGVNDKEVLEETIKDLAAHYPGVRSIGVVPVGLTKYQKRHIAPCDRRAAVDALSLVEVLAERFRAGLGEAVVYPADELFWLSGKPLWPEEYYGSYPQIENGVGMARQFISEVNEHLSPLPHKDVAIATGVAAASLLAPAFSAIRKAGARITVIPVENRFFGPQVTVSGLLTSGDLAHALKRPLKGPVLIPASMLNRGRFLDGKTAAWLDRAVNAELVFTPPDGESLLSSLKEVL